jgi:protease-4
MDNENPPAAPGSAGPGVSTPKPDTNPTSFTHAANPPTPPPVMPSYGPAVEGGAPRARRAGRGWMYVALILFVLLAFSVLLNIGALVESFAGSIGSISGQSHVVHRVTGPRFDEVIREDNGSRNKVALVAIDGVIFGGALDPGGFSMVDYVKAELNRAGEDGRVKAVILRIDSPGGEVLASDEIYRAIADFQEETGKPVVASMGNLAASGGYYVAAPCQWIVANELTITGSIGVMMRSWNYRNLMDKVGVVPQTFKSGKFKDMLSSEKKPEDILPEERAMVQSLIDETYTRFKEVVRDGRSNAAELNLKGKQKNRTLVDDWEEYADGRIFSGSEAYKLGFVDELGNFEDAFARARALAGIDDANIIEYRQRYDFSDFFRMFGKSEAKTVKLDLGVEMPKLEAGTLYFLSQHVAW